MLQWIVDEENGGKQPMRSTDGSAGYDLYAPTDGIINANDQSIIPMKFKVAIPSGYVGIIEARSSLAVKHNLAKMAGVIDSDYRDWVCVVMRNYGRHYHYKKHDRIAQLVIHRIYDGPDCVVTKFIENEIDVKEVNEVKAQENEVKAQENEVNELEVNELEVNEVKELEVEVKTQEIDVKELEVNEVKELEVKAQENEVKVQVNEVKELEVDIEVKELEVNELEVQENEVKVLEVKVQENDVEELNDVQTKVIEIEKIIDLNTKKSTKQKRHRRRVGGFGSTGK